MKMSLSRNGEGVLDEDFLKIELVRLFREGLLPLDGFTRQGGLVDSAGISVTLLSTVPEGNIVQVRIGVFFQEIVGGCSCGDDPYLANGYGELNLRVDTRDGVVELQS